MTDKPHHPWKGVLAVLCAGMVSAATPPVADTSGSFRTAWGDPDLQGLWANGSMTPFERPEEFSDKEFLTPQEGKTFLEAQIKAFEGRDGREYDNVFMERGPLVKTLRTSLIVDPPDGKLPSLTAAAQKQLAINNERRKLGGGADGPEDRPLPERCIHWIGSGPAMGPEPYNGNYLIVQTKEYVVLVSEQGHLRRIIPLQKRPPLPENVRFWGGDSRGHWEGNSLVVESANIRSVPHATRWPIFPGTMADENLRVTERFTRTAADTIMYQATVTDPTVYVRPWTIEYNLYPSQGPLLEVACHEGNYGLAEILSARRAEEKRGLRKQP